MWEMILAGRYMMIPITLASLVGLAVLIERIFVLRQGRIVVPEISEAVMTLSASQDLSVAYAICDRRPGPFANVVRAGLDHADNDWTVIRDVLEEVGRQEATRLTRRLGVLETVAAVSPLLGLLGTVLGMIRVFATISLAGLGNPETLSAGISEAMVTTAAGLIIGIPALVAHNWLEGRAQGIIFELELYSTKVLATLRRRQHAQRARTLEATRQATKGSLTVAGEAVPGTQAPGTQVG
jgi:biopolymer transport protein ExbB